MCHSSFSLPFYSYTTYSFLLFLLPTQAPSPNRPQLPPSPTAPHPNLTQTGSCTNNIDPQLMLHADKIKTLKLSISSSPENGTLTHTYTSSPWPFSTPVQRITSRCRQYSTNQNGEQIPPFNNPAATFSAGRASPVRLLRRSGSE